jgi:hypothetical protein
MSCEASCVVGRDCGVVAQANVVMIVMMIMMVMMTSIFDVVIIHTPTMLTTSVQSALR